MTPPTPRGMGDFDPPEDLPEDDRFPEDDRVPEECDDDPAPEDYAEHGDDPAPDWPEPPDHWHGVDPKEKP